MINSVTCTGIVWLNQSCDLFCRLEQSAETRQRKYRKLKDAREEQAAQEREANEQVRLLTERIAALEHERNLLMDTLTSDLDRLVAESNCDSAKFNTKKQTVSDDVIVWLADFRSKLGHVFSQLQLRQGKQLRQRKQHSPSEEDTGYTSASPRHSVSVYAANDSPINGASCHDAESKRRLEAIEKQICNLLRNLQDNHCWPGFTLTQSSKSSQFSAASSSSSSSSSHGPQMQTIVNRCSRLQDSVRVLKQLTALSASPVSASVNWIRIFLFFTPRLFQYTKFEPHLFSFSVILSRSWQSDFAASLMFVWNYYWLHLL